MKQVMETEIFKKIRLLLTDIENNVSDKENLVWKKEYLKELMKELEEKLS